MLKRIVYCGLLIVLAAAGGCSSLRTTDPSRTATEQYLLSIAAERAVEQLSVTSVRGRAVYVDVAYFAAAEQLFVLGELRAHLLLSGARLMPTRDEAEIVLEVRSRGVGIDRYDSLFGLPSIPLGSITAVAGQTPVPIATPEIALVKNVKQWGFASVAFVAYWRDTGEVIASSGPAMGRSYREDWWIFGLGPRTSGTIPTTRPPE